MTFTRKPDEPHRAKTHAILGVEARTRQACEEAIGRQ